MQAVILAAGKGLRLRPFTENHPKPLIPIAGKPLLEYTLEALPDTTTEVIIIIGYLGDQIKAHFGDSWNHLPITYVVQEELKGTGDALLQAQPLLKGTFLAINGDDLYQKKDLAKLAAKPMGILAWESTKPTEFGLNIDGNNLLRGFDSTSSLVNCGAYCLDVRFFNTPLVGITVHGTTEYSLPHTLASLSDFLQIHVVHATGWLPVGTPQQLDFANNYYIGKHK